tara:strand:+ start:1346 stop:1840 length:495 start_codon:yes stop_codon:yes gene_type:complete
MNKQLLLVISLAFIFQSCAGSSSSRTTAVKRATETREYEVSAKDLITASIGTFQDLGYTIDVLSPEFGLITASKKQAGSSQSVNSESVGESILRGIFGIESNDNVIVIPLTLSATITIKEISNNPTLSSLRVNFEGGQRKFSDLFFKSFFAALDKSLFLDQAID